MRLGDLNSSACMLSDLNEKMNLKGVCKKLSNTLFTVIKKIEKCHKVLRYTRKCNLPVLIFTKLTKTQQHYVQILYRIPSKRESKRGKYGHKYFYVPH
jgi:hypothetical protein